MMLVTSQKIYIKWKHLKNNNYTERENGKVYEMITAVKAISAYEKYLGFFFLINNY